MRASRSAFPFTALLLAAACGGSSKTYVAPDCCAAADAGADVRMFVPGRDSGGGHDSGSTAPRDAGADRTVARVDSSVPAPDVGAPRVDAGHATDADACTVCGRDWSQFPAVAQFDGASELWVVSDIHADYSAATKLLAAGHLLASVPAMASAAAAAQWSGGSATFVIVGDMIDKGPDAPDLLTLIRALQTSASAAGGRVVVTMGNHEAEFLANPENSSATGSNGVDSQLQEAGLGVDATAAGSDAVGQWLRQLPFAARVDDWFFVHAGNTGGATIAALTSQLEMGVDSSGFAANVLIGPDSMLEARLNSDPPQWWDATGNATALLTAWTTALGVQHLVMGHQPGKVGISGSAPHRPQDQMAAEYGGLLFLIDTGMSVDVDDTGGALLHVTGVGTASEAWEEVLPDGSIRSL